MFTNLPALNAQLHCTMSIKNLLKNFKIENVHLFHNKAKWKKTHPNIHKHYSQIQTDK